MCKIFRTFAAEMKNKGYLYALYALFLLAACADKKPPLRHTLYFYGVCTVSFYFKMYLTLPLTPIKGQAFSLYIYGRSACFQFKSL